MSSSLLKKLSALNTAQPALRPRREDGLIERTSSEPADARVFSLDIEGLRRMGCVTPRFDIAKCLFLDTETTGLSSGAGTVVFLVGLGQIADGRFRVDQYMIRDYPSEALLLEEIARRLEVCDTVISYNGKTFDMPLIKSRFTLMRMADRYREPYELDLLYPARRLWKLRLDSVKLGNVEEKILGIRREDDVPGSEVPQRFFDYLKDGDLTRLEGVIDHNRQDIVSLQKLLCELNDRYARPEAMESRLDLFSAGKAMERGGDLGLSRRLYEIAAKPAVLRLGSLKENAIGGEANRRLYLLLRREGRYEECRMTLDTMIRRKQKGIFPYVETAKLLEHRSKDEKGALEYTEKAFLMCDETDREALEKRRTRLMRKIGQKTGKDE